ncbi:hypothetical protein EMMF5_000952 [Cystobasidiomycetes sp. EMM_F5]
MASKRTYDALDASDEELWSPSPRSKRPKRRTLSSRHISPVPELIKDDTSSHSASSWGRAATPPFSETNVVLLSPPGPATPAAPRASSIHPSESIWSKSGGSSVRKPSPPKSEYLRERNDDQRGNLPYRQDSVGQSAHDMSAQIKRLQSDLARAQEEISTEKRMRSERLRQVMQRNMELMSVSSLGEEKVDVLRAQLRAEREVRERLEEELDRLSRSRGSSSEPTRPPSSSSNATGRSTQLYKLGMSSRPSS